MPLKIHELTDSHQINGLDRYPDRRMHPAMEWIAAEAHAIVDATDPEPDWEWADGVWTDDDTIEPTARVFDSEGRTVARIV